MPAPKAMAVPTLKVAVILVPVIEDAREPVPMLTAWRIFVPVLEISVTVMATPPVLSVRARVPIPMLNSSLIPTLLWMVVPILAVTTVVATKVKLAVATIVMLAVAITACCVLCDKAMVIPRPSPARAVALPPRRLLLLPRPCSHRF